MITLGIDIGGTGIKGALVDVERGELTTERFRIPTPETRTPEDVLPVVQKVIEHFDYTGPIGIGFPAVVVNGVPLSPFTAHHIMEWVGFPVAEQLQELSGCEISMANDADAAGLAEMRFGAGRDKQGVVVVLTLGTGIGSGLFVDGQLVPNSEFGKLYLRDKKRFAEYYSAESAREREGLKWSEWGQRLDKYLHHVAQLFTPQLIILGGGGSKKFAKFSDQLTLNTPVVPAELLNHAGIIGAAMVAV